MLNKKIFLIFGLVFLIGIFLSVFVAGAEFNFCCEKTVSGAWCINAPEEKCDSGFRKVPTSCEATAYCKLGCCYDSQEGTCMKNTPQKVCQDSGGVWEDNADCEIPQCDLGCCLIGDQAAFVTQTRCKRLNSIYGLEINFRTDISSEVQCIASATSDVKGACVFEKDFERTCEFITKRACLESENEAEFFEGKLCSAESLNTICGPSEKTTCVEGKDEVYFLDSCGNLANIYDASKFKNKEYWSEVYDKSESCGAGNSNAESKDCGNCDYYLGSTCGKPEIGGGAKYGDYICKDLGCKYEGERYEHGETWCAKNRGISKILSSGVGEINSEKENLPGSRYFRMVCYNGEVTVEPCADFRQEVCIESSIEDFSTAACRVNKWQDCYAQENQKDCENGDRRDCRWIDGISINEPQAGGVSGTSSEKQAFSGTEDASITGGFLGFGDDEEEEEDDKNDGACVPLYAPGFNFWEANSEAESVCSQANVQCVVVWEKGLTGDPECVSGCGCIASSWEDKMNQACIALGDCGAKTNYLGVKGFHDGSAVYSKKLEGEE